MKKKNSGDALYEADKAVKDFCKTHKGNLSEEEHLELSGLLNKRASAMSDALGVEIHSICEDDDY